jgi:IS30 family transposase
LAADPDVTWTEVGRRIGRHRATVAREVARNGGRADYRAGRAHARAQSLRPCRPALLSRDRGLAAKVAAHLKAGYSPAGTAHLLGGVCTETIYRAVYTGTLDVKACDVLRSRRHRRRRRDHRDHRAVSHFLGAFTSIHDRPAAVADRVEFGHWEGDLIIGARNASALITLNERTSRTQIVLDLPHGYRAEPTIERLGGWAATMPHNVLKSITWDRGSEMAHWESLAMQWGVDVYFADAHSPWQRGQNENGNRQLRYWLPKGTDLSRHAQHDLDAICNVLNTQPRRSLNWKAPNDLYADHAAR